MNMFDRKIQGGGEGYVLDQGWKSNSRSSNCQAIALISHSSSYSLLLLLLLLLLLFLLLLLLLLFITRYYYYF